LIGEGGMKECNPGVFYHLGSELAYIRTMKTGAPITEIVMMLSSSKKWLDAFMFETLGVPVNDARDTAAALLHTINAITLQWQQEPTKEAFLETGTNMMVRKQLQTFQDAFDRECHNIDVFAVTPKDDKDIRILVKDAIQNWEPKLLAVLPDKTKDDLREAGRCLAFERATACAFHTCRATEALMLAYYEKLAKQPWPHSQKDWGIYNKELIALKAPDRITTRLDEIRKLDRNAYAHPDISVPLDEAPIIYGLCRNVIFLIAKEMI
jgi:hypothetical protein